MTPIKTVAGQRYWTPRLGLANVVFNIGGMILWFFVTNWMTDIKSDLKDIKGEVKTQISETNNRRIIAAAWRQNATDRMDSIETRLVKLER